MDLHLVSHPGDHTRRLHLLLVDLDEETKGSCGCLVDPKERIRLLQELTNCLKSSGDHATLPVHGFGVCHAISQLQVSTLDLQVILNS